MKKINKRLRNAIYLVLCIVASGCKKHNDVWVTHRCNNDNMWTRDYKVQNNLYYVFRCDMCLTVTEIKDGKIINEDMTMKREPVNTWLQ